MYIYADCDYEDDYFYGTAKIDGKTISVSSGDDIDEFIENIGAERFGGTTKLLIKLTYKAKTKIDRKKMRHEISRERELEMEFEIKRK